MIWICGHDTYLFLFLFFFLFSGAGRRVALLIYDLTVRAWRLWVKKGYEVYILMVILIKRVKLCF